MAGFSVLWRVLKHEKAVFKLCCLLLCVFSLWGCGQRPGGKTPDSRAPESKPLELISYEIGDAGVTITDCNTAADGHLEIPAEIEGLSVTSIGAGAFASCRSLTSITIPESVNSIGDHVFNYCSSLTSVAIPDGVTSIGTGAFASCSSLNSVTIPDSVTSIGTSAFRNCSRLNSVTIPQGVNSIEEYAFHGCSSLTEITIPQAFHSEAEASRLALKNCGLTTSHCLLAQPSKQAKAFAYLLLK